MADTLIHEIPTTATSFASDDYIVLDGVTNGTRNMTQANLKNSVIAGNLAPAFSTETDYAVGDLVTYSGQLYRCKDAHSAGAWASANFQATTFKDEVARNSELADVINAITSQFDASTACVAGKLYWYNGDLYKCNTAYTGSWDSTKFDATTIDGELRSILGYATNVAHSIATEFIPNSTTTVAGKLYMHDGVLYEAKENYVGVWDSSKFKVSPLNDTILTLKNSVPVSADEITKIEDVLFDKDIISSVTALSFATVSYVPKFTNSTFSGHGIFLGSVPTFRYMYMRVHCFVSSSTSITKIAVQFRRNTYTGNSLRNFEFNVEIAPNTNKLILLDFMENVTLDGDIYMDIKFNSYGSLYRSLSNTYDRDYQHSGRYGVYFTNGNISESYAGSVDTSNISNGDLVWSLLSSADIEYILNQTQIDYITSKLGVVATNNKVSICSSEITKIEGTLFDKDVESSVTALSFASDETSVKYSSGTFSGHGLYIGTLPRFRYMYMPVHCNSGSTTGLTKIVIQFRKSTYNGTNLRNFEFDIDRIAPNASKTVLLDFMEDVEINENVYMTIKFNTNASLYTSSSNTYDRDYQHDGRYGVYCTSGNISSSYTGSIVSGNVSNGDLVWALLSSADIDYVLKQAQIDYIASKLNVMEHVDVSLPSKIYAVVGDTLQLFFKGMVKCVNCYNYDLLVTCAKGAKKKRRFDYLPQATDVGSYSFNLKVKNNRGNVVGEGNSTIVVKSATSPSSEKKVLIFGDSLTAQAVWVREFKRRISSSGGNPAGSNLSNISFCGAMESEGANYYGVGGWVWANYTSGSYMPAFRFNVSGVTSLSIGATYTNNGHTYTIREVNITSGSGNILCSVSNADYTPLTSGTLTKTSGNGDDTITYSSASADTQNPLWDFTNNKMTFVNYANNYSDGQIDFVYVLLGWNGLTNWQTDFSPIITRVKMFADTLHTEFPSAKLKLMGLQVPSQIGGMGANYGATGAYSDEYGMMIAAMNLNDAYHEFANREGYSSFVEYVGVPCEFDADYNGQASMQAVNSRQTSTTELIGTNGVHPATSGYMQIADTAFRNLVGNL